MHLADHAGVQVLWWRWTFLALMLAHLAQTVLTREVLPYTGTLSIAALAGHTASSNGRQLGSAPGFDAPQLAGLGALTSLATAAAVVDGHNDGYGWPTDFGPASSTAAILPAMLAAVLLPIAVVGAIQLNSRRQPQTKLLRDRLRTTGIALLPALALFFGLVGAAAGVPKPRKPE